MIKTTPAKHGAVFLVASAWVLVVSACTDPETTSSILLQPGVSLEASVDASDLQRTYGIELAQSQIVEVSVEQHGLNIVLEILDPAGGLLFKVDHVRSRRGREQVWWRAETTGTFRIAVRAPVKESSGGHFRIRHALLEDPESSASEPLGRSDSALVHRLQGTRELWLADRRGEPDMASLERALAHWLAAEDIERAVWTSLRLAEEHGRHDGSGEVSMLLETLHLAEHRGGEASDALRFEILHRLGRVHRRLGDLDGAQTAQARAFDLARTLGLPAEQASCLNQLALLAEERHTPRLALRLFRQALQLARASRHGRLVASLLHNLGQTYGHLGKFDLAMESLQEACVLNERFGSRRSLASSRFQLAWVVYLTGRHREALELFEQVRVTYRELGDRRSHAAVLDRLGTVLQAMGRFHEAKALYSEVVAEAVRRGDPYGEAHGSLNAAEAALALGDIETAQRDIARSLARFQDLPSDDLFGRAHALFLESRVLATQGEWTKAIERSSRTLELIETLRLNAARPSLTLPFFATRHGYFEHHIDLLLRRAQEAPEKGYLERALEDFERAHARSLTESIGQERQGWVRTREELDLGAAKIAESVASGSVAQIRESIDALSDLQAATAATEPPNLDVSEIQALLGESTLVLVYHLGDEASHVWSVDRQSITGNVLVAREPLEKAASSLLEKIAISDSGAQRQSFELARARLSAWLLDPVAERLEHASRLVIIGDGALHSLPFAMLRSPQGGTLLGERFEVVRASSASLVAALRSRSQRREMASGIAIFADPMFGGSQGATAGIQHRAATDWAFAVDPAFLPRLHASRREARDIAALWDREPKWLGLGPEASEHSLEALDLSQFRVLHFATHALQHPVHPEMSAIVLSGPADANGVTDGLLQAYEIASLHLSADLVVLSACRTATGKEVIGEGVLGLSRAFLQAGATSALVSLWSVDDAATATLMVAFYRGLVEQGLSKPAALQVAQREVRSHAKWEEPFYWAGFELHGDWR